MLPVLGRFFIEAPFAVFQYNKGAFFSEVAVSLLHLVQKRGRWKSCAWSQESLVYVAHFYSYLVRFGKLTCPWAGHGFAALVMVFGYLSCYSSFRQVLFGDNVKKPQSLSDADLSKLYTATSLMQIDDNVMRYEGGLYAALWVSGSAFCFKCYSCRSLSVPVGIWWNAALTTPNPSLSLHWIKPHKKKFIFDSHSFCKVIQEAFIYNVWTCSPE